MGPSLRPDPRVRTRTVLPARAVTVLPGRAVTVLPGRAVRVRRPAAARAGTRTRTPTVYYPTTVAASDDCDRRKSSQALKSTRGPLKPERGPMSKTHGDDGSAQPDLQPRR
jgi:hypothetical protein